MVSASDGKAFEELDHHLEKIRLQKGVLDCNTYQSIRPNLVKVIAIINALPGWARPGWVGTVISALQALMSMLDSVCPQP